MTFFRQHLYRGAITTVFLYLAIALVFGGCTSKDEKEEKKNRNEEPDLYVLEVTKDRKEKDLLLLTSDQSPLLPGDKDRFEGLAYYPVTRDYAFATVIRRYENPREFMMNTSKGIPRRMLTIGYVEFDFAGKKNRLEVYAPVDTANGEPYFFIPFTDATTGDETYGGGRYLDFSADTDSIMLDFNYAYNPYCAYNPGYDCPIPPAENHLDIAVRAGEKNYPLHAN
ncbi:MAG: DUF1684 domain-containing protein [Chlorobi bacterium]|nr:DUF1684 domain-containing protein [Chlorobiota bacterium]